MDDIGGWRWYVPHYGKKSLFCIENCQFTASLWTNSTYACFIILYFFFLLSFPVLLIVTTIINNNYICHFVTGWVIYFCTKITFTNTHTYVYICMYIYQYVAWVVSICAYACKDVVVSFEIL